MDHTLVFIATCCINQHDKITLIAELIKQNANIDCNVSDFIKHLWFNHYLNPTLNPNACEIILEVIQEMVELREI